MSTPVRLAVFDCDGTLTDGQAAVCVAMERAFAACALPAPGRNRIRRSVGLSLPQALAMLAPHLDAGTQDALVDAYKTAFRAARADGSLHEPLFDGIADLLRDLRAKGWTLAVATGKSDRGLRLTLETHGLADLFATLHTADRYPSKPHPAMLQSAMAAVLADPAQTVMIGDTVYDIHMAAAAGTRAIGVDWGYHGAEELLTAGALAVADTPQALGEMLDATF